MRSKSCWLVALLLPIVANGCVRRTMTINTAPVEGARVYLNDEDVGLSPVSVDFTWYGDYDVVVRHDDYQTLKTNWRVREPWYQIPPLDFFSEVLTPVTLHDQHESTFTLTERTTPTRDELVQRAAQMRETTLFAEE